MGKNFRFMEHNAQWRNTENGAIRHLFYQGVLYFKNIVRFHITRFIIISFIFFVFITLFFNRICLACIVVILRVFDYLICICYTLCAFVISYVYLLYLMCICYILCVFVVLLCVFVVSMCICCPRMCICCTMCVLIFLFRCRTAG